MMTEDSEQSCDTDFITIHNGPGSTSPLLRLLCGFYIPRDTVGTASSMFIRFQTNSLVSFRGWEVQFSNEGKLIIHATFSIRFGSLKLIFC